MFQGFWNGKVSTIGLVQLFLNGRESLNRIIVKGDFVITEANSNTIMTRAKARNNPDQFQAIPFPAKALKILLHDVQNSIESSGTKGAGIMTDDAESDDGDDEWADDGAEFTAAGGDRDLAFLSGKFSPINLSRFTED